MWHTYICYFSCFLLSWIFYSVPRLSYHIYFVIFSLFIFSFSVSFHANLLFIFFFCLHFQPLSAVWLCQFVVYSQMLFCIAHFLLFPSGLTQLIDTYISAAYILFYCAFHELSNSRLITSRKPFEADANKFYKLLHSFGSTWGNVTATSVSFCWHEYVAV